MTMTVLPSDRRRIEGLQPGDDPSLARGIDHPSDHRQFPALGIDQVEVLERPPNRRLPSVGEKAGSGQDPDVVGDIGERLLKLVAGFPRTAGLPPRVLPTQQPLAGRVLQRSRNLLQLILRWFVVHRRLPRRARWEPGRSFTQMPLYWSSTIDLVQIKITREKSADNQRRLRHDPLVSEVAEAFGARVAELRIAAGLTQDQLADLAELHRTEISNLETAKNKNAARIDTAIKLSGALGVGLCDLLQGLPSWTPPSRKPGGFSSR